MKINLFELSKPVLWVIFAVYMYVGAGDRIVTGLVIALAMHSVYKYPPLKRYLEGKKVGDLFNKSEKG